MTHTSSQPIISPQNIVPHSPTANTSYSNSPHKLDRPIFLPPAQLITRVLLDDATAVSASGRLPSALRSALPTSTLELTYTIIDYSGTILPSVFDTTPSARIGISSTSVDCSNGFNGSSLTSAGISSITAARWFSQTSAFPARQSFSWHHARLDQIASRCLLLDSIIHRSIRPFITPMGRRFWC